PPALRQVGGGGAAQPARRSLGRVMKQASFSRKTYRSGAVIFREGEDGVSAYIVESGRIEIVKEEGGERRRIGTIGPGGLFGEMALVDNKPRMATAVAVSDSCVVVVPGATFRAKI